ncbi:MAG: fatty acid desaturase [Verrucomicrobia bacterium]|nr:fatty acid desaturase [Verrucomicrobiota bacterium]
MSTSEKNAPIRWYRTPLAPAVFNSLHERSDARGLLQCLGYLGVLALTGGAAFYAAGHAPVPVVVALLFLHGTCFSFQINAVHELGHGTVFRTKWLNALFERMTAFLGWINFETFNASHARHHRYTLHPPDDREVVLPVKIVVRDFFREGFFNIATTPGTPTALIMDAVRIAAGKFKGEWELELFPPDAPEKRRPAIAWAWTLLVGHGLIIAVSCYYKLWMVPVLTTFAMFCGNWLFFLCNKTQHIGLQDNVPDFRLCCRTFLLNPVARFLYWHMNYHTEHHMYAAVPCYKLGKLHAAIQHDLPPCPVGIFATWKEIAAIQRRQQQDPAYQYAAPLPSSPAS